MIKICGISVYYKKLLALDDISLNVNEGKIIGIIGPNGAGKSTLLKAMLNILPHTGYVKLDQIDIKNSLKEVAYVEQKTDIDTTFPIKVKEVVSLGTYPKLHIFQKVLISEKNIMDTLNDLKREGKTILVVHHDLNKVKEYFDDLIILNKKLIAYGHVSDVFTGKNLKEAYGDSVFMGEV